MAIFYSTENLPAFSNPVITIGTFDGVHAGHKAILETVRQYANRSGGESILLTFEPHPRKLIYPDQPISLLTPLNKKIELILRSGIHHVVVVPFTLEFAAMTAREYITDFLVKKFSPDAIVIGYDHHFGADRKGNIHLLKEMQDQYGYHLVEIPEQMIEEAAVSSTKIRNLVAKGKMRQAAILLDRHYTVAGKVVQGAQLGRTLGYPTANIVPDEPEQIIPANGVYAVRVIVHETIRGGMLNIGIRPTVSSVAVRHIEAHIFDFNDNIYGKSIEIEFVEHIRPEEKFASLEALKARLVLDEQQAKAILS